MPIAELAGLELHNVVTGDISLGGDDYRFEAAPALDGDIRQSSDNWAGYISVYELSAEHRLQLLRYEIQSDPVREQSVEERLEGDFWLTMTPPWSPENDDLFLPHTYVPFQGGMMVLDRSQWRETPAMPSNLMLLFRRPTMFTAHGSMDELLAFLSGWSMGSRSGLPSETPIAAEIAQLVQWLAALVGDGTHTHAGAAPFLSDALHQVFADDESFRRAARHFILGWPVELPP